MKESFFKQIINLPNKFWLLNLVQMIERLAYWVVVLQMPIYIAQKDVEGGLGWSQSTKGIIFFIWALVQNITPIIAGVLADRYGRKKFLLITIIIAIIGFLIMGSQREYLGFIVGTIILGVALGSFKPALQGSIAFLLDKRAAIGWGIYIMLINFAVFFGAPLSKYLKEISWQSMFIGSAIILGLNIIIIIFIKEDNIQKTEIKLKNLHKKVVNHFSQARVWQFILIISGFTMLYMQFYESLPNYIFDWIDTSKTAMALNLPDTMLTEMWAGKMISYEWLFSINSGFIVIAIAFVSWLFSKIKILNAVTIGILVSAIGLAIAGFALEGFLLIAGIITYTLGEMIANPKINEYLSSLSAKEDKSLYLSFTGISWTIGLAGGAILGGVLYELMAEKAVLASWYLKEKYDFNYVELENSFIQLVEASGLSPIEVTDLLYKTYHPQYFWIIFLAIGFISLIAMYFYLRKYNIGNEK